jgi:hypothetical protein
MEDEDRRAPNRAPGVEGAEDIPERDAGHDEPDPEDDVHEGRREVLLG